MRSSRSPAARGRSSSPTPPDRHAKRIRQIVQKLWNYCNVLRDDGLSYGDYVEQLTYLLFLKMADEQTQPPCEQAIADPDGLRLAEPAWRWTATSWRSTTARRPGELGKKTGMLGIIFRKAQNKIQDPAKLRRLIVELIDQRAVDGARRRREGRRLRGPAGEERPGHEGRRRPVLHPAAAHPGHRGRACGPQPGETICDPACGTGGFLLAAHDYIARTTPKLDQGPEAAPAGYDALRGVELVDGVARLCAMNLLLHGIGPTATRRAARSGPTTACAPSRATASTWC